MMWTQTMEFTNRLNNEHCSRPGCTARLVSSSNGSTTAADIINEAELIQQQQAASQKPYRVGLILLCVGALFNWLGLAQAYVEPMRYIGVGCIVAGALLICAAMCRWLGRNGPVTNNRSDAFRHNIDDISGTSREEGSIPSVHVITLSRNVPHNHGETNKPPDYDSLVVAPPSYEDAIKLAVFSPPPHPPQSSPTINIVNENDGIAKEDEAVGVNTPNTCER